MPLKFGQLLLQTDLVTEEQLDAALEYQRAHGGRLGEILCELGYLTNEDLTRTLGAKYGVSTADTNQLQPEPAILALVPPAMARQHRIIPLRRNGSALTCAMVDPTRMDSINEVQFQTGCHLQPVLVTPAVMAAALARFYPERPASSDPGSKPERPPRTALVADIVRRLDKLPAQKLDLIRRFLDSIE